MIRKILLISLLMALSISSCKKVDELTHFTINIDEQTTIDPIPVVPNMPLNIPIPEVTTNSSENFENNNTNKDLVEDARLKKMTLTVSSPESGDFSFLNDVEVYMKAEGLEETLIASKHDIEGGKTIDLDCEDKDLSAYIKKDTIEFRIKTTVDEITLDEYTIDIHTEFLIDAKILGI